MSKLTPKQQTFAQEYLASLNATQAAIRAGYSVKTAYSQGQRLLKNVEVQAVIQGIRAKLIQKTDIAIERILEEYRRIAFSDIRSVMEWSKTRITLKDSGELTDEDSAMIAEISETTSQHGGSIKIKLHDKLRALEGIRKMLGFDTPVKQELPDSPDGEVLVRTWMDFLLLAQTADPAKVRALEDRVFSGATGEVIDGPVDLGGEPDGTDS